MLADIGNNVLINTNEIRNIRIQYVDTRASDRWVIMVYTTDEHYDTISTHKTEEEAIENMERIRAVLRNANCLIDLQTVIRK